MLLVLLLLLAACGSSAAPGKPAPGGLLVGYYLPRGGAAPYRVLDVERSGAARRLTHLVYAFGAVTGGRCAAAAPATDYEHTVAAADSVDGAAADGGEFGQLRRLKQRNPALKVLWSFGGWNGSAGFTDAARDPRAFAASCKEVLDDPRWAGVFDGIDLDWEYPNACGAGCDTSGPDALARVVAAMREALGPDRLVTAAVTADATSGGRLGRADYAVAAGSLDWMMAMTYDYAGTGDPAGPTAPHSALRSYPGESRAGSDADAAIGRLRQDGVPAGKLLLGVGFYGRGWTGVSQDSPGGSATGPAPGGRGSGAEDYRVLRTACPATGTVGGQVYARCGDQWWSYDTPQTLAGKAAYVRDQGLAGVFCWELGGDTPDGELLGALQAALD
ncbi:glycoside hydrolase family 18 protein [Dactylosporangium sp. CS-033363]|uniref:glycoside hydrolase family 18 protein n=1 Tax=Dactylosporangium sp. CS-033363 TaxID=3239935 RepID=UPI003D8ED9F0